MAVEKARTMVWRNVAKKGVTTATKNIEKLISEWRGKHSKNLLI